MFEKYRYKEEKQGDTLLPPITLPPTIHSKTQKNKSNGKKTIPQKATPTISNHTLPSFSPLPSLISSTPFKLESFRYLHHQSSFEKWLNDQKPVYFTVKIPPCALDDPFFSLYILSWFKILECELEEYNEKKNKRERVKHFRLFIYNHHSKSTKSVLLQTKEEEERNDEKEEEEKVIINHINFQYAFRNFFYQYCK